MGNGDKEQAWCSRCIRFSRQRAHKIYGNIRGYLLQLHFLCERRETMVDFDNRFAPLLSGVMIGKCKFRPAARPFNNFLSLPSLHFHPIPPVSLLSPPSPFQLPSSPRGNRCHCFPEDMGLLTLVAEPLRASLSDSSILFIVTASFFGLLVLVITGHVLQQLLFKKPDEPPIVFHWIPFIGSTVTYGIDPYKFFLSAREKVNT